MLHGQMGLQRRKDHFLRADRSRRVCVMMPPAVVSLNHKIIWSQAKTYLFFFYDAIGGRLIIVLKRPQLMKLSRCFSSHLRLWIILVQRLLNCFLFQKHPPPLFLAHCSSCRMTSAVSSLPILYTFLSCSLDALMTHPAFIMNHLLGKLAMLQRTKWGLLH